MDFKIGDMMILLYQDGSVNFGFVIDIIKDGKNSNYRIKDYEGDTLISKNAIELIKPRKELLDIYKKYYDIYRQTRTKQNSINNIIDIFSCDKKAIKKINSNLSNEIMNATISEDIVCYTCYNNIRYINKFANKNILKKEYKICNYNKNEYRYGFNDGLGVVSKHYDFLDPNDEETGLHYISYTGRWLFTFINTRGNEVIPIKKAGFVDVRAFSEGLSAVKSCEPKYNGSIDKYFHFIDKDMNTVLPSIYEDVKCFKYGLCPVKKDGKWGVINKQGVWVIQNLFQSINIENKNIIRVEHDYKYYNVDKQGNIIN